jgi:hypothetical protein
MTDREKIISAIEKAKKQSAEYAQDRIIVPFKETDMILALLKEQEAVEPYSMNAERTYGICPQCGKIIFRYGNVEENHYCGVCGKAVKWNDA